MLAGGISPVRADVTHGQGSTEVVFRRRGTVGRLFGFVLAVAAWLFGLMFGIVLMAAGNAAQPWFYPAWLSGWGLGGVFGLGLMLMNALGVESIIARSESLTLMRRLLLLRFPARVAAEDLVDIRWVPDDPARTVRVNGRRIPQTSIEIVTGSRRLAGARGIGEAEAQVAIAALRQRLVTRWERR